ncbi:MAG: lysine--tRNA ligase [Bacillota bacterium]|nr:lysine--tRNA ligase [Bacillota bacterium]
MENLNELLLIRREKLANLQAAGRDPYRVDRYDRDSFAGDILERFDEYEGKEVAIAGRIMANRDMGKASFVDVLDSTGRIQVYVRKDMIGDEEYEYFKTYDIGDIIGLKGVVFRTKKEEKSVKASEVVLLTKSLQILPEKFHGLKDVETRYRQRYVDMIVNPEVKDTLMKKFKIMAAMKEYFVKEKFVEVETPVLSVIAGGANAKPFITHHNAYDIDMYMRIANELYLKRLIVGGFDKVFEMGKMFRNEGVSYKHHPEYTSVELYAAYRNYEYMIEVTEQAISRSCLAVNGSMKVKYDEFELDFTPPWRRVSMHDLVKEKTGVDFYALSSDEEARQIAKHKLNLEVSESMTKGSLVNLAFEEFCEEDLIQPTFVLHHPVEVSPLAKRNPDHPEYTNRFEAFAAKMEIANGFSELNDPIDQRARFEEQARKKAAGDEEAHMMDYDFLNAIEVGLPPTAGLGIGVDRAIMILTDNQNIREIIPFPTMKLK